MKRTVLLSVLAVLFFSVSGYAQDSEKLVSSKSHIKFFSTTSAEDIEANNSASVSTINKSTGELVFSVPMQGFEFEKALMQKHFNSDKFLDTQTHQKAKLKGKITNLNEIDFTKDGTYNAIVEGDLTIKGKTNLVKEKGTITVKGGQVLLYWIFAITHLYRSKHFINGAYTISVIIISVWFAKMIVFWVYALLSKTVLKKFSFLSARINQVIGFILIAIGIVQY